MNKAAAVQMCPTSDLAKNLEQAAQLIQRAVDAGAELIVLPENFAYPGNRSIKQGMTAERDADGPARRFLSAQARQQGAWIVGGTLPIADGTGAASEGDGDKAYAACLVFDPAGNQVARYNKMHLFDVDVDDRVGRYRESERYIAGQAPVVVKTDLGKVGPSVCYDLRFPELYRQLLEQGAEILAVPSAFTAVTGEAHWELLLRARAVENLCYVIGADQGDRDAAKPTWGGSCIVDPWGQVLAEQDQGPGVVVAEVGLQKLQRLRSQLPAIEHRRFGVVKK